MWKPIETAPRDRNIVIGNAFSCYPVSFCADGTICEPESGDLWLTADGEHTIPVDDNKATHWCERPPFNPN